MVHSGMAHIFEPKKQIMLNCSTIFSLTPTPVVRALIGTPNLHARTETRNYPYSVLGFWENTPWHAPVPWHFSGIFGNYHDPGLQAEDVQFRVSVLVLAWIKEERADKRRAGRKY